MSGRGFACAEGRQGVKRTIGMMSEDVNECGSGEKRILIGKVLEGGLERGRPLWRGRDGDIVVINNNGNLIQ